MDCETAFMKRAKTLARDCQALPATRCKLRGGNICTGTSGRLIIRSYLDLPDKDYMICHYPYNLFLNLAIRLPSTCAQQHLFALKNTCGTLSAIYKTGTRTDSRGTNWIR